MTKKPDKVKFLEDFNNAVDHFVDHSYPKIIAISHNDADGISSLHIIQNLLYQLKIDYDYFIYNRSVSWENYLNGILSKRQTDKNGFILTDVGSNLKELIPIISNTHHIKGIFSFLKSIISKESNTTNAIIKPKTPNNIASQSVV